jgi:hypothetical protein
VRNGPDATTRHLAADERERYRQRRTTPGELLELDAHLATCAPCREELLPADRLRAGVVALRAQLETDAAGAEDHPSHQDVAAHVDRRLEAIDAEVVESHLAACPPCAEDAEDLRALGRALAAGEGAGRPHRRRWPPPAALWAAGIATVALLGAGVLTASLRNQVAALEAEQRRLLDADRALRHDRDELAAELARLQEARAAADSHPAAARTLQDAAGRIVLGRDGRVAGLGPLSPPEEQHVRTALATGRIQVPAGLGGLLAGPPSLRGPAEGTDLDPLQPLGTVVESDRPTFRWRPLPGARGYVVAVYDSRLDKVAASATLTTTEWRPVLPLRRGVTYSWQITALGDGHERTAPAPPAPEARFKVLEREQVEALAQARRRVPRSHLLLAMQFASAGLLDDAERELRALVSVDPGSRLARELLESLRAARRPGAGASPRD